MNERSVLYMSKLIADKSKAGINYEEIPRVIVINFLKHGLRKEKDCYQAVGDPELKRRYDYYISGVSDENTRLSRAKREGLEQGLKQGKIDTAKKLKKQIFLMR